jgi:hypothetical protein
MDVAAHQDICAVVVGHQVHTVIELVARGDVGCGDDRLAQPAFGVISHCAAGDDACDVSTGRDQPVVEVVGVRPGAIDVKQASGVVAEGVACRAGVLVQAVPTSPSGRRAGESLL